MALDLGCKTTEYYIGDGVQTDFTFSFQLLDDADLRVGIYNTTTNEYDETTDWSKPDSTSIVRFDTAPENGIKIIVYRLTEVDPLKAIFHPGHPVKAADLNDNFEQLQFAILDDRCAIERLQDAIDSLEDSLPITDVGTFRKTFYVVYGQTLFELPPAWDSSSSPKPFIFLNGTLLISSEYNFTQINGIWHLKLTLPALENDIIDFIYSLDSESGDGDGGVAGVSSIYPGNNISVSSTTGDVVISSSAISTVIGGNNIDVETNGTEVTINSTAETLVYSGVVDLTGEHTLRATPPLKQDLFLNTGDGIISASWAAEITNASAGDPCFPGDFVVYNQTNYELISAGGPPTTDGLWVESAGRLFPATLGNNVGIGTDDPQAMLDVDGLIQTSGGVKVSGGSADTVVDGLLKGDRTVELIADSRSIIRLNGLDNLDLQLLPIVENTTANQGYGCVIGPSIKNSEFTNETHGLRLQPNLEGLKTPNLSFFSAVYLPNYTKPTEVDECSGFSVVNSVAIGNNKNFGYLSGLTSDGDKNFNFYSPATAPNFLKGSTYIGGTTARNTLELWKSTLTEEQLETLEAGTLDVPANVSLPGDGSFARAWYYDQQDAETQAELTAGTLDYPEHLLAANFIDNFALGDNTKINLLSNGRAFFNSKVGIGTNSPEEFLHVKTSGSTFIRAESTNTGSGSDVAALEIKTVLSRAGGLKGLDENDNELWFIGRHYDGGNPATRLDFDVAGSTAMSIPTNGNVGIGTSSPNAPLHVSAAQNILLKLASTTDRSRMVFAPNNTDLWNIGASSSDNSFNFYDSTADSTRLKIDSSGNVSIGSNDPQAKLDVDGTAFIGKGGEDSEILRLNTDRPWGFFQRGSGANTVLDLASADNKSFSISSKKQGEENLSASVFIGGSNGNVGIGTTDPQAKLDVDGDIKATSFRIDLLETLS